jgi:hypothetical protein
MNKDNVPCLPMINLALTVCFLTYKTSPDLDHWLQLKPRSTGPDTGIGYITEHASIGLASMILTVWHHIE